MKLIWLMNGSHFGGPNPRLDPRFICFELTIRTHVNSLQPSFKNNSDAVVSTTNPDGGNSNPILKPLVVTAADSTAGNENRKVIAIPHYLGISMSNSFSKLRINSEFKSFYYCAGRAQALHSQGAAQGEAARESAARRTPTR